MIKFFRNIRQRLLVDLPAGKAGNRFIRYLIYAIGEIVLVVCGILIALQINNWNETRKNANFERAILESFKESLESDLSDIKYNVQIHHRSLAACDSLLVIIERNGEYDEDVVASLFSEAFFFTRFVHSTSAFESLKSKGVNIISNNVLQKKIVDVYDSRYRFFLETENDYVDYFYEGMYSIYPGRFEEGFNYDLSVKGFPGDLRPLNFDDLKKDEEFLYYLKTTRNWTNIFIEFHYAGLQADVEELISMIDEELQLTEES